MLESSFIYMEKKRNFFKSITFTLIIAFFLLNLFVRLVSSFVDLLMTFRTQQRLVANEQHLIANNAASAVKTFISEKYSILKASVRVGNISSGEKDELKITIERLLGLDPSFRQLTILDINGEELVRTSRLSDKIPLRLTGEIKSNLIEKTKNQENYFSPIYIDEFSNEPMAIIAIPVLDVFGDIKGILAAEINLKFMWDLVGQIKIGEDGECYVVDENGSLIAYTDIGRILKEENLSQLNVVNQFINNEKANTLTSGNNKGIRGTYVVTTFVPLENPDWAVVIEVPTVEAYKNMAQVLLRSLLILLLSVFLTISVGVIISRKITKPIVLLRNTALEVSQGKFETNIQIKSNEELEDLANAFNQMSSQLREYTEGLEVKIEERTQELNKKLKELEEANKYSQESKLAMLNLLEDAKKLEGDLTRERDRAQAIVTSMGEGLLVINPDYKVALINPIAEKLLGVTAKDAIGQDWSSLVKAYEGNTEIPLKTRAAVRTLGDGKVIVTEIEDNHYYLTKKGRKFPISAITAPLKNDEGKIIGAVKVFRDVTQLKQLDEAKTGFISIASHQLRTPLTSMRWFSEMLIGGDAGTITDEQKHFVERIYQGTDRMISLVNMLLQIARVEAGRVKIEPVSIDLKEITTGVLMTLKTPLSSKSQNINITSDPDPFPQIAMDQEVIWQVIQNLISNAGRYSHEGSTIEVNIRKDGEFALYSVKDSGIGIPKDAQKRVFEKFYRAENALKLVPEGSGLGLSLVKMLVTGWGGKIWFESEEGKGTTFFFTVPLSGMQAKEGEVKLAV